LWVKSNFQNIPKVVEVSKGNKRRQVLTWSHLVILSMFCQPRKILKLECVSCFSLTIYVSSKNEPSTN
jgi:hypothetical protein